MLDDLLDELDSLDDECGLLDDLLVADGTGTPPLLFELCGLLDDLLDELDSLVDLLTCSVTVRVHVSVAPDLPPVGLPIDVPTVEPLRSVTVFVRVAAPGEHDVV